MFVAGRGVKGLVEVDPRLATVISREPYWLPAKALSPAGSNIREFGGVEKADGLPAMLAEVAIS